MKNNLELAEFLAGVFNHSARVSFVLEKAHREAPANAALRQRNRPHPSGSIEFGLTKQCARLKGLLGERGMSSKSRRFWSELAANGSDKKSLHVLLASLQKDYAKKSA